MTSPGAPRRAARVRSLSEARRSSRIFPFALRCAVGGQSVLFPERNVMTQAATSPRRSLRVLPHERLDPVPLWVHALATPVWVTAPDGSLEFLNDAAATLLDLPVGTGRGLPCHDVVAGRDSAERPHCGAHCHTAQRAACGQPLEPVEVRIGSDGAARWIEMMVIPVTADDGTGPWLVHCARDIDRQRRAADYVCRIANRSEPLRALEGAATADALTGREIEILDLLVEDEDLGRIAHRLGIRHTTVRNHVQRILAKLGAHSVQEAAALRVLKAVPVQPD